MIGRQVSHYRIVSKVGDGGMGVVYEAEDTRLGRHVALKFLPPQALAVPEAVERFRREARIISSLNHPHICTLHDVGDFDGQQFMVMELLDGKSIKDLIAAGPVPVDDVLELVGQMAAALDVAHSVGIIHRDLKPANLFVVEHGGAKILDFGVAKLTQPDAGASRQLDETSAPTLEVSSAGSAVGTITYMSPEQARGESIDGRSDLFSLGAVMYEMLTGVRAFQGSTAAVVFEGILAKDPPPPSTLRSDVPADLDRVVAKALAKAPAARYQSAAEFAADVKRLKRETEHGAPTLVTSGNGRGWGAVLVGGPLVMAAAVAMFLWQSQGTPALTERDTVVLADFQNRTGDAIFDDTLSEALSVQIRQSPFVHLLPDQEVQSTLRLMGRRPGEAITMEVAREICQRQQAKAVLGGTIASVGSTYLLTLRAQNCLDGDVVAEVQREAADKESVIRTLGTAASEFRANLGESLSTVQRYEQDIETATTTSLEALKAYSQGMEARRTTGDRAAIPFFERAIQLDPDFALAHGRLGTVLSNLGHSERAQQETTRAFELRDRVSERERYYIEARYHTTVERDTRKAIDAYRLLIASYPDDYAAHANLGSLYRSERLNREAVVALEQAVRLAPNQPLGLLNLANAYFDEGRTAEAKTRLEESIKLSDAVNARTFLLTIAVVTNDAALEREQLEALGSRANDVEVVGSRAQIAQLRGRMTEASKLNDTLYRLAQATDRLPSASEGLLGLTITEALSGRSHTARAGFARLASDVGVSDSASDEAVMLGIALEDMALARRYTQRALKSALSRTSSSTDRAAEDGTRALIAFVDGRYGEAYDLAQSAATPSGYAIDYVAALAAMKLQRWDAAVETLDRITKRRTRQLIPALAPVWILIARAHAQSHRPLDAKRAYEEAFEVWKDADPDLPLLIAARNEYERLGR